MIQGRSIFVRVWIALLVLTACEVLLAYFRAAPALMLAVLIGLSLAKAVLIIACFMHMRWETPRLAWALGPAFLFIVLLLLLMLPDAAHAQCVQCARTAAAQGPARVNVLFRGMLVLLVPPVAIFAAILLAAKRRPGG